MITADIFRGPLLCLFGRTYAILPLAALQLLDSDDSPRNGPALQKENYRVPVVIVGAVVAIIRRFQAVTGVPGVVPVGHLQKIAGVNPPRKLYRSRGQYAHCVPTAEAPHGGGLKIHGPNRSAGNKLGAVGNRTACFFTAFIWAGSYKYFVRILRSRPSHKERRTSVAEKHYFRMNNSEITQFD